MKKLFKLIILAAVIAMAIPLNSGYAKAEPLDEKGFSGIWVATVLNIDYPSKPSADAEVLKQEAVKILDDAKRLGMNAVFLQVRPSGDALYKSRFYPWSKYLTGRQGLAPGGGFDPLEFWVAEAHKRGIELHAWINPYRVTKKTISEPKHDINSLDPANPAVRNPDWVVKHGDGNLYLNPGIPVVRKYITDSVMEIVQNYEVDGIHMDDYFYPGKSFDDKDAYSRYGKSFKDINDWRRENINLLVSEISETLKMHSPAVRFGISPFGIWANKSSNSLGSDTRGAQTYYEHFADTRKWVKEKTIDYIIPQLYWNIGYSIADYEKLAAWWIDVAKGTGVDLYIGQAAYRALNSDPASPWYGVGEIEKQLDMNSQNPEIKGSVFYNYSSIAKNPPLFSLLQAYYGKRDEIQAGIPVSIAVPGDDIKTRYDQYYICGSSDPEKPLLLNGEPVENRSSQGFFGILVKLKEGANTFAFSQEGSSSAVSIFKEAASKPPEKMKKAEILSSSVFPRSQELRMPGEKIILSCQAPIGSKVTVAIGGKSYAMDPSSTTKAIDGGIYSAAFTYAYTIPSYTGNPRNVDLGAPVYKMSYKGMTNSVKAPAKIGVVMKNSPYYAEVIANGIFTYPAPDGNNGGIHELQKGMTDYATGMTGDYVRLAMGQWVDKKSVRTYTGQSRMRAKVSKVTYTAGESWDKLTLGISTPSLAVASYENGELRLAIAGLAEGVLPKLPEGALLSCVETKVKEGDGEYILKLKKDQNIAGYYIEKTDKDIILNIKRPVSGKSGPYPLSGIRIMLDPGHGGDSLGAVGPLGKEYSEKVINLKTAMKLKYELESLGAQVLMTRTEDKAVSLEERLAASKTAKPDLFISIHSNSMADNIDISKVNGFSVFYRDAHAYPIAEEIHYDTIKSLNRNDKGIHKKSFYVFRGTWTPSILLESGFVPNPAEFEWLIDDDEQSILAKSLAQTILKYYTE
ncbi:family 10 glycosylhydrolase [Lutispora sp.]|uniref:family 10 glycosylhydrolase n=1 Tax=Lutispora sp. TaxID=2828727 RepID=UPI002B20BDBE|nr:family 10 glycosylhydrolase [Lutispora sp.]MEA4962362.1 family 10 glycosylhydrolase [Lutispora sp.]